MKQRDIERASGWAAVVCWFLLLATIAVAGGIAASMPHHYLVTEHVTATDSARKGHHAQRNAVARQVENPDYSERINELIMMGFLELVTGFAAFALTGWWAWRRRKRVNAETLAEVLERSSLARAGRDRRAAGI